MSVYRLFVLLCAAAALLVVPAALAQDAAWTLFAVSGTGDERELLTITADGIAERLTLPPEFPANYEALALSPDGKWLATIPAQWNRVVLMNVADEECCTEFSFTDKEVFLSTLGGFNADSSQLALSFVSEDAPQTAMLTLDVSSGGIVTFVDTTEVDSSDPNVLYYPILTGWRDDGIHYVTSCIYCVDAAMDTRLSVWDPVAGTRSPGAGQYDYRSDRLALNGSHLDVVFALDYPSSADAEAIFWGAEEFGVRNAVVLTGEQAENGQAVIYATAEHSNLITRWAADGDVILIFFSNDSPGSGIALLPSGETLALDFPASQFLAGTPDGWVGKASGVLTHYRIEDGEIVARELGTYTGSLTLAQGPALGADASDFPTVPPPEPVTCPGFMPSRLQVGHLGRVLPGPANNMRDEPSTTGTIIAKIAGAEAFAILEGPVCSQGLAWWRVAFRNQEGWTAEGSGQNYWLEQAPENGYRAPTE